MQKQKLITIIITVAIILLAGKVEAEEIDITANFVDENLRNSILELAKEATQIDDKTQIYESDIDKIVNKVGGTSLKLAGKEIKDLAGIEAFADKEITWIFLDWNEITDLTPLQNFTNLTKISFSGNQVSDLSPLSNLENLENLTAINNKITTLNTINNLSNMKYICLDGNVLTNIDDISNWSNLIEISFRNNQITELPDLSQLQKLQTINLSNNMIQTINTMPKLESVENLEIDNNKLISLEGIQNLTNLKTLSCSNNQITQISGIERLNNLENLNINKNQLQDISKIQQNTQVKYLYMDNNMILNFEVLKNLANLQKYSIYNQTISVEIKEKLIGDYALIPLPDLYKNLYNNNSAAYQKDIRTQVIGTDKFEVDTTKKYIKLKTNDLRNNSITVEVINNTNTFLKYIIQVDKIAPVIEGVRSNQIYSEPVTPVCDDDDIEEVQLTREGLKTVYKLGDTITEKGIYVLRISDKAGNQSIAQFEIRYENIESDSYKVESQYITNITNNTTVSAFRKKLQTKMDYEIYRDEKKLGNNEFVATGDRLETEYRKNYYLIVKGDINKDGMTNITDLVQLRKYILKLQTFDEMKEKAADLNDDKRQDIQDLVRIRKIIINNLN